MRTAYDLNAPDDLAKCRLGFPGQTYMPDTAALHIPSVRRTHSSAYLKNGRYMIINPEAFIAAAGLPVSR
jgi:hypothetical protein